MVTMQKKSKNDNYLFGFIFNKNHAGPSGIRKTGKVVVIECNELNMKLR
jgi:hypothetical protein